MKRPAVGHRLRPGVIAGVLLVIALAPVPARSVSASHAPHTFQVEIGCRQASGGAIAEVRKVIGSLQMKRGRSAWKQVDVGTQLRAKDSVRTRGSQRAQIQFCDESTLDVNSKTQVQLTSSADAVVRAGEAAETVSVQSVHTLDTAGVKARPSGGTVDVVSQQSKTTVTAASGVVEVANQKGTVLLKTGQTTNVEQHQKPGAPKPVDATTVIQWTNGLPVPDLGENIALDANGGHVSASSSKGSHWPVGQINDARLDKGWESGAGSVQGQTLTFSFAGNQAYRISDVIIDPAATGGDPAAADLKDFQIRVSNTGTEPSDFVTVAQSTVKQEDVLQGVTLPQAVVAKYVQLVVVSNYGDPTTVAVSEMEIDATPVAFNLPFSLAVDAQGNLFVADTQNDRVMKLSSTGRPLAVFGQKGSAPGQLKDPVDVTLDGQGDMYVVDAGNLRIQKLSSTGQPLQQWPATRDSSTPQQLLRPQGVAVDSAGNLYVFADGVSGILKMTSGGQILARYATSPDIHPHHIFLDRAGNLYISDVFGHVTKVGPTGSVVSTWGSQGSGTGELNQPLGVAVDTAGNVWVADSLNGRIVKYSPTGDVLATVRVPGEPIDLALDAAGNIFVLDASGTGITELSPAGQLITRFGHFGTIPEVLFKAYDVAIDGAGNSYIVDESQDRIQKRAPGGQVLTVWGKPGVQNGQFSDPVAIALDPHGNIAVLDRSSRIQTFSPDGTFLSTVRVSDPSLSYPGGLAFDPSGNMYVAEGRPADVRKIAPDGKTLSVFTSNQFVEPWDVALDSQGNVYVGDADGNRVVKLSPDGQVGAVWSGLGFVTGVTVNNQGYVYVGADTRILELSPSGQHVAAFGSWGIQPGQLNESAGMTVDATGNVWVADSANQRVQVFSPTGQVIKVLE